MTGIDYNVDLHQVNTNNPNHMSVEASELRLPPGYFPNWISTTDIGNGSPFYADKILREVTNASDVEATEIEYGEVEAYLYRQNAGNLRLLVLND